MGAVRQALPVPQRVMAVVLSVLFVFCPFAAYAAAVSYTHLTLPTKLEV